MAALFFFLNSAACEALEVKAFVDAPFLEELKARLDVLLSNVSMAGGLEQDDL